MQYWSKTCNYTESEIKIPLIPPSKTWRSVRKSLETIPLVPFLTKQQAKRIQKGALNLISEQKSGKSKQEKKLKFIYWEMSHRISKIHFLHEFFLLI